MCVPNNIEIEDAFCWLLNEFESKKETLPRHIIFSESISDVSKIYAIFRKRMGESEHYEMFHSKTVESKKEYIRSDMTKDGKIRILICTNSAGMGVNFYKVCNIIHYGLPREMDTFVQQMGRAGRDGEYAHELIVYKFHKGQLKRVEEELVQLAKDTKCRREILCSSYGCKLDQVVPMHMCCDICEKSCKCDDLNCPNTHPAHLFELKEDQVDHMCRDVNSADRVLLKQKLDALQFKLSNFSTVVKSELIHGLSVDVIDYVVQHVENIFTPEDIMKNCAVWSYDVASQISNVINEIFGDDALYSVVDTDTEDED
jgi:superfamily II DNA helicase RecQ